ncbi:6-phosphofructokinase [Cellulomonas fimi]|uniref:ATP-dependent 6-phosphofructokinase n=1 Tax=Cellulomonas fimi (strain ATCC 484 / DSM 20113 / JCM 1341 / CCUG 24087 / LMG 16345 / NBRC 15513 / NCIMB 8980 / NCTC 7547 / NRS-133) TaxID=590998 RepID=F4H3K9_CELFA|nr:ATP-dependent 6-phosphofructokinase [Cellulomonas fimi]AEE47675.1 phosphofructokinase [Cellulomonas fimi ATCC 484]NNH07430.1 ATP-dependent 6-phosphofructokinase [Cellulomonas fimi]VEH36773.1 Pyrophosphate--fructose 6-phosphate 1-phosphotransferase [Cellulomonas fimi]
MADGKVKRVGILTAGGDSPGLNAAIRGFGKAAIGAYGMELIGFRDGVTGLVENRSVPLDGAALSGILTVGGTILGTSRDKVHRWVVDGEVRDMVPTVVENYHREGLDALVMLGGGGTAKNAMKLVEAGLNVIHLPKTIDNDIARTDTTFGFATATEIATEAIDRVHSTAHSHHRIILTEIMGHRAGWLTLGAGIAGGADIILIPEIPYTVESIAETIRARRARGSNFSVIAVAEGARDVGDTADFEAARLLVKAAKTPEAVKAAKAHLAHVEDQQREHTFKLARELEAATSLESRVTILGYVQRGGAPVAADRILATRLGAAAADALARGESGVMVAARGEGTELVPLAEVAGKVKLVPPDHEWITAARQVGTGLGD